MHGIHPARFQDRYRMAGASGMGVSLMLSCTLVAGYFLTGGHDAQRIAQLLLFLVFCGFKLLELSRPSSTSLPTQAGWGGFLTVFFALGVASSVQAFMPRYALYEVSSLLILLMLSMQAAREISRDSLKHISILLKISAYGGLLYIVQVTAIYISALVSGLQPTVASFAPSFSNFRFLNHAQTVALPLFVLLTVLDKRGEKMKPAWLGLTAFWWALLIVTGGRGTFTGMVAGGALVFILRRQHARVFLRALWQTAVLGGAMYALLFVAIPLARGMAPFGSVLELANRTVHSPTSSRMELWSRAFELISEHPWLGVGPLHFAHGLVNIRAAHPHDLILQIGSEWGLPALFCLCVAIGLAMRNLLGTAKLISPQDTKQQTILTAWIFIAVAILVDGMVSGLLVMPVSQLSIALYIACATGWSMSLQPACTAKAATGVSRAVSALVVSAAVLGLVWGVWPGVKIFIGMEAAPKQEIAVDEVGTIPRLWRNGYF